VNDIGVSKKTVFNFAQVLGTISKGTTLLAFGSDNGATLGRLGLNDFVDNNSTTQYIDVMKLSQLYFFDNCAFNDCI